MRIYFILLLIICITSSCEDVVDIELNQAPPKLVIDASINWFKGTSGNQQEIKLTLTAPYFANAVPPANDAQVRVLNSSNEEFIFIEDGATGIYRNNTFIPSINETYTLVVMYLGETYTATETLKSVASIEYIEQNDEGGFSGEETEIKAYYTDPADEENYYLFEFISDIPSFPILEVYKDEFTNGNQIFGFYTEEALGPGDEVIIRNYGVSKRFYEFMFIILQQSGEEGGGPFETQPATVRGNCINQTNPQNFPLGYFRCSEVDEVVYVVQ